MSFHGVTRKGREISQSTIRHPAPFESQHPQASGPPCLSPDVRVRKKYRGTLPERLRKLFWRTVLGRFPRLHGIAVEIRSLPWRSEFQSKLHQRRLSLVLGPDSEISPTGHVVRCRRTHARIADTENFESICPKATCFEMWVFLQGWEAGERYALRNSDTREMEAGTQA
jgi:hypothetical protein